ncbi:MAG: aromatic amino acid ammonia-lyase [Patescibacteria group bacterium]
MKTEIVLNGHNLTLEEAVAVARGSFDHQGNRVYPIVSLDPQARHDIKEFRDGLEARIAAGDIIYGVNTGCGIKKGTIIPNNEIDDYQAHYIPAHCVGFGEPFSEEIVRLAMVLRVNSFALGNSGIRLETCDKLLELYNKGVIPFVPSQGSVGASGDLCPLAHMAATMLAVPGQRAYFGDILTSAGKALHLAEIKPHVLKAKEAMGLTNGSTFTLAMGLLAVYDVKKLNMYSHFAAALSLEAVRGEKAAFDPRVHAARQNNYSMQVAKTILNLTANSQRMTEEARAVCLEAEKKTKKYSDEAHTKVVPRVQDAYSFRGYPQVAGPAWRNWEYARDVFTEEMNAATDNPLIFKIHSEGEEDRFEALSGGNFHGEPLAMAADILKLGVQSLANISNSRFYALTMPSTSYGLPADLAGPFNNELNTGYMILQYTTAALVSENKVLCFPSVVDSIPTSANQEDYVSMGTISARHLLKVVHNTYGVIAAELIAAAQGISLTDDELKISGCDQLGDMTTLIYNNIRKVVPPMLEDRYIYADFQKVYNYLLEHEPLDLISEE